MSGIRATTRLDVLHALLDEHRVLDHGRSTLAEAATDDE